MSRSIRRVLPVLAVLVLVPLPLRAQSHATDQGSFLVSGRAAFTSSGSDSPLPGDNPRTTTIFLQPAVQYFITPGLALGAQLNLGYTKRGESSATSYGLGPAATYYFGRGERKAYPYLGASLNFQRDSHDSDGPGIPDLTTTGYRGAAGVLFMLASAVGINAELFYSGSEVESGNSESESDIYGLAVGISAFVF